MENRNPREQEYRAWLIYDKDRASINRSYIQMHFDTGSRYGIRFELLMTDEAERRLEEGRGEPFPDFAIVRAICPGLTAQLEKFFPVFNPAFVSEICNHKEKTISYIREHTNIPVIETTFYKNDRLSEPLLRNYPNHVVKSVDGHGGKQVFRTADPYPLIHRGIGSSDFIIQPFVRGPGKDIRVYVIGKEIVGAVERTSTDGFRSNYSLGGGISSHLPDRRLRRMVEEICRLFDFGLAGIDFIVEEGGGLVFNEIEDVVGARMLYQCCPDIRLLDRYFLFIRDKILHCD